MSEERSAPYYCPYCGGEDLRPHAPEDTSSLHREGRGRSSNSEQEHGAWECRECTRVFSLRFLGLLSRNTGGFDADETA